MQQGNFETINISLEGKEIDYSLAKRLSEDIVSTMITEPMLIAWFDGKKKRGTSGSSAMPAQTWMVSLCGRLWRSGSC